MSTPFAWLKILSHRDLGWVLMCSLCWCTQTHLLFFFFSLSQNGGKPFESSLRMSHCRTFCWYSQSNFPLNFSAISSYFLFFIFPIFFTYTMEIWTINQRDDIHCYSKRKKWNNSVNSVTTKKNQSVFRCMYEL